MKKRPAALGFRVKSGWAASVLLAGSIDSPRLCESRVIELSDPHNSATRQPYHAARGKLETNATRLKRRIDDVRCTTERSIVDLLAQYMENGYVIRRAALVVGSVIDPGSIANPHIRACLGGTLVSNHAGSRIGAFESAAPDSPTCDHRRDRFSLKIDFYISHLKATRDWIMIGLVKA